MYKLVSWTTIFARAEELRCQMQLEEALKLYFHAEEMGCNPDQCSAARWTCYMLLGECELAWTESDRISARGGIDPHQYWHGEDWTNKHVLIRCLHGLGDTIQFIRYSKLVADRARSVTIEAQPKLKALLSQSQLASRVISWGEPEGDWDVQMEVNELPRIFRATCSTIPQTVPYLIAEREQLPKPRLGGRELDVGLIWAASDFDPTRNIPWDLVLRLFEIPGTRFFSLQAGEGWRSELPVGVASLSEKQTEIEKIASAMANLDLVVSVDTMNAHLAGALGVPTWTVLPFQCDWRWMTQRLDTPWYPTMKLFRQPSPGDWMTVIDRLRGELSSLAGSKRAPAIATRSSR